MKRIRGMTNGGQSGCSRLGQARQSFHPEPTEEEAEYSGRESGA
jgi:hypothetical protein